MNSSILTAIESLCDDIATNTNPEDNKKRAEAVVSLAFAGIFTPAEYDDEYEDETSEGEAVPVANVSKVPQAGERFTRGGIEFVALGMEQGGVLAVAAKRLEDEMAYDEDGCNDWRKSSLRKYLNEEFVKNFNKDDLLPFVSDLTSDDGMTDYGTSEDSVALLSDNLYRKYRKFMPKYDTWVWTITPWSCLPGNASYERTVNTSGALSYYYAFHGYGVAPACIFNPEIFK
uniref:hypothetical protein n=1 Tax=Alistipes sp. TaxID=1872444 RepID=UPI0040562599